MNYSEQRLQYAHKKVQHHAIELRKAQRLFEDNSSNIQHELIDKAIELLIKADDLNHVCKNLDVYSIVDGMNANQVSTLL